MKIHRKHYDGDRQQWLVALVEKEGKVFKVRFDWMSERAIFVKTFFDSKARPNWEGL